MISLRALRANLVEINRAKSQDDLVAIGKNRVLCKHYGWGRFIHIITFGRQSSHTVETTLHNIRRSFHERIASLDQQRCIYFQHFGRELRGERFSIKDKEKTEQALLQFCLHMKPLMRDVMRNRDASYLNIILDSKKELLNEWKRTFTIIRLFQKMKNLEVTLKAPLPYVPLLKASSGQPVKAREKDLLSNWLVRLGRTRNQKLVSFKGDAPCNYSKVRFLHRFLRDLVSMFNELLQDDTKRCTVAVLEEYLKRLGCPSFVIQDNKHLEWAKSLAPKKSIVRAQGTDYELGEILQRDDAHPEIPVVFDIKSHPGLELVIECNEAVGYLKDHQAELLHCGIFRPEAIAIEEKGRALIREKVPYALSDIQWRSKGRVLDKSYDLPAAQPVVELIKGLMRLPFTPRPLTQDSFGFNAKGEMRARKLLVARDKSWVAIENFVHEIAGEDMNHPVYKYLMKETGLSNYVVRKLEK